LDFAIGARYITLIVCTLQTQNSPGRWAQLPCPAAGTAKSPPLLEGSRHRIRLLRVLSHSHGKLGVCAGKHDARRKAFRTATVQKALALDIVLCVCRSHGWLFLRFLRILSPFRRFHHPIRMNPLFQAEIQHFSARYMDFPAGASYNTIKVCCA